MAVEVKIKKWGNSFGIIVPNKLMEQKNLKENDSIIIEVVKRADLSHLFGSLKPKKKMTGQQFKDSVRDKWN